VFDWVAREFKRGTMVFKVAEEDKEALREICEYWSDKDVKESFQRYMGEEVIKQRLDMCDNGAWLFPFSES